ncbi:MAG TPA: hypothetical protein PLZ84_03485 [Clostridia bacterium]|nr:hypothetical protein [Clostridia bacterium]
MLTEDDIETIKMLMEAEPSYDLTNVFYYHNLLLSELDKNIYDYFTDAITKEQLFETEVPNMDRKVKQYWSGVKKYLK